MSALSIRLAESTAEVRATLWGVIEDAVENEVPALRAKTQAAFTDARAAVDRAEECLDVVRRRTPVGRKRDLPGVNPAVSHQQWLLQSEKNNERGALSREEAVEAFRDADAAADDAVRLYRDYVQARATWNEMVGVMAGAVAAAAAPWIESTKVGPSSTGLLVRDGRPIGCVIAGQRLEAAQDLPAPSAAAAHSVVRTHAQLFEESWVAPPPPPAEQPPPTPTPWDPPAVEPRPAGPATADPVALARARRVATMG